MTECGITGCEEEGDAGRFDAAWNIPGLPPKNILALPLCVEHMRAMFSGTLTHVSLGEGHE